MSRKVRIGIMPNILLFGEQIYHKQEHLMPILWWKQGITGQKWSESVRIMPNTTSLPIFGSGRAGTDGALAMAMTHVILNEFYVKQQVPYFINYAKKYTDLPFLVTIKQNGSDYRTDTFLRAKDLGDTQNLAEWKTVVWDENTNKPEIPNGSIGFRWDGDSKWNLNLTKENGKEINPLLSFLNQSDEVIEVTFPYFAEEEGGVIRRGVPVKHVKDADGHILKVTTVFDLMMAHVGVNRGLSGEYPEDYHDPLPYTPAWQEEITGYIEIM